MTQDDLNKRVFNSTDKVLCKYNGVAVHIITLQELTKDQNVDFITFRDLTISICDNGIKVVKYPTDDNDYDQVSGLFISKDDFIHNSDVFELFVTECVKLINYYQYVSPSINIRTRDLSVDCLSAVLNRAFEIYEVTDLYKSRGLYDIVREANKGVKLNSSGMTMLYEPYYDAYYRGMMLFSEVSL